VCVCVCVCVCGRVHGCGGVDVQTVTDIEVDKHGEAFMYVGPLMWR
jgi:hypothetical protein